MTLETIKLPKDVIGEIRQFIVPHPLAFVLKDGLSWIINMKTNHHKDIKIIIATHNNLKDQQYHQ